MHFDDCVKSDKDTFVGNFKGVSYNPQCGFLPEFAVSEVLELSTSITAVTCIDSNTILAGLGGHILVITKSSDGKWSLALKHKIFNYQSIYGIIYHEPLMVAVYGGRQYSVQHLKLSSENFKEIHTGQVNDWILDLKWLDNSLALLTAHGQLMEIVPHSGNIVRRSLCPDRSILYSGRIVYSSWSDLIVLSGTVHNQVLVWTTQGTDQSDSSSRILATLEGHKGVIFSVRYDEETNMICSTSDDRTARLWKINLVKGKSVSEPCWIEAQVALHLTLFGHKARVFQSAFLPSSLLVTIGEDGGVMVWNDVGDCISQHWVQGALLCLDYVSASGENSGLMLATGGNDGSLCLFPLPSSLPALQSLNIDGDMPRQVVLTDKNRPVLFCEGGRILIFYDSQWSHALTIEGSDSERSYSVLSMSPSHKYLALATINGNLFIYSVNCNSLNLLCSNQSNKVKVFSVHWLKDNLILACYAKGELRLLTVSTSSTLSGCHLIESGWFEIAESKERWTTCAALYGVSYMVCGDRQGSIYTFEIDLNEKKENQLILKPAKHTIKRAHARGVTSIIETVDGVMTCGRDSTIKKYLLISGSLKHILTHKINMEWASHLILSPLFGYLVLGFHSVYLCVWSLSERRFLLKMKCWGGHRSWDFSLSTDEILSLAFIKDCCVHTFSSPLTSIALPMLLTGLHHKTINACVPYKRWLVTGGEDCSMRLCSIDGLKTVSCVVSHLSSVRALCSLPDSSLVVSGGGRAQLKLWDITSSGDLRELCSHMLRNQEELTISAPLDQPEIRYMSLSAFPVNNNCNLLKLCTAASDGIIRVFEVDKEKEELYFMYQEERYAGRCLLQIICKQYYNRILSVTGGTDGRVIFWLVGNTCMNQIGMFHLHCAGVNSLALKELPQSKGFLLFTGGDDGTLVISLISVEEDIVSLEWSNPIKHIHTCQITGIALADHVEGFVATAGLDQRICLLKYDISGKQMNFTHIGTYISTVPDIHGLNICIEVSDTDDDAGLPEEFIVACIFGMGVERVRLSLYPRSDKESISGLSDISRVVL